MATLGSNNLGLLDISRRKDPDGTVATVVELLHDRNDMIADAVAIECNDGTRHKTTVRTGLVNGTWRKLYEGVQSTASATQQVLDGTGMLEMLPRIDVDVVDKSGDPSGTLFSEHTAHIEGMGQDFATTLWYGDTSLNPERFQGLDQRYNVLDTGDDTVSSHNVLNGGGSGSDNTSVWLIGWGEQGCALLYPQGSTAGMSHRNLGRQLTADADGNEFEAYVTKYKWDVGLTVRDWRCVGRIANIDVSNLEAESSAADLVKLMIRLSERVHLNGLRPVWYMHERVRTMLRIQILGNSNVNLTFENVEGKMVMMFDGIPVHVSEALLLTESAIS